MRLLPSHLSRTLLRPPCAALLAAALIASLPSAVGEPATFFTTLAWHDNATNGERPSDILPAAQLLTELAASSRFVFDRDDTLLVSPRLLVETWPRYGGLDRALPGFRATWQHKFALGPYAPTLRFETAGDVVLAREAGRSGLSGTATVAYRQRLTPSVTAQLGHEVARHDARALAFDRTGRETTALLGWQSPLAWHLSLTLAQRHGDVLAYSTPPRPDLVANGKKLVFVGTFDRSTPLIAYYFTARTQSAELRAGHPLGRTSALVVSATWRKTTHGVSSSYLNRVFSISLHHSL